MIALASLGRLYREKGEYASAAACLEQALEASRKSSGPPGPAVAQIMTLLGLVYGEAGKLPPAEPLFQNALEINRKHYGPLHPEVASSLDNLADLLHRMGKTTEAETAFLQAGETWRRTGRQRPSGPGHQFRQSRSLHLVICSIRCCGPVVSRGQQNIFEVARRQASGLPDETG